MSNYEAMVKTAQKRKTVKKIDVEYIKWEKPGITITGKLMGRTIVHDETSGREYTQYIFDTDKGPVKCAPGSAFDGELGSMMSDGNIYVLTFKGKEDISEGRRVNRFELFEVPAFVDGSEDAE